MTRKVYIPIVFIPFLKIHAEIFGLGRFLGLNRYNPNTDDFERLLEIDVFIYDIEEYNNKLWFTTEGNGIYVFNPENQTWKQYLFNHNDLSSLIDNEVMCLCVDDDKQLWIGNKRRSLPLRCYGRLFYPS